MGIPAGGVHDGGRVWFLAAVVVATALGAWIGGPAYSPELF